MSLSPSSDTRQATEPKYTVSARLVTIRNIRESRLISATPQPSNFEAAASSFAESENAETLTKANFSPTAARPRGDDQLIGVESNPQQIYGLFVSRGAATQDFRHTQGTRPSEVD